MHIYIQISLLEGSNHTTLATLGPVDLAAIAVASDRAVRVPAIALMEATATVRAITDASSDSRAQLTHGRLKLIMTHTAQHVQIGGIRASYEPGAIAVVWVHGRANRGHA